VYHSNLYLAYLNRSDTPEDPEAEVEVEREG
jgi:hypothetical protein